MLSSINTKKDLYYSLHQIMLLFFILFSGIWAGFACSLAISLDICYLQPVHVCFNCKVN